MSQETQAWWQDWPIFGATVERTTRNALFDSRMEQTIQPLIEAMRRMSPKGVAAIADELMSMTVDELREMPDEFVEGMRNQAIMGLALIARQAFDEYE